MCNCVYNTVLSFRKSLDLQHLDFGSHALPDESQKYRSFQACTLVVLAHLEHCGTCEQLNYCNLYILSSFIFQKIIITQVLHLQFLASTVSTTFKPTATKAIVVVFDCSCISSVFSNFINIKNDIDIDKFLSLGGILFHAVGPTYKNQREPIVLADVTSTNRWQRPVIQEGRYVLAFCMEFRCKSIQLRNDSERRIPSLRKWFWRMIVKLRI